MDAKRWIVAGLILAAAIVGLWWSAARTADPLATPTLEMVPIVAAAPTARADAAVVIAADAAVDATPPDAPLAVKHGVGVGARPGALRAPAGRLSLVMVDGFAVVNLAGGPASVKPTVTPFGPPTRVATRPFTGRVVDRAGSGVAGAIVLADRALDVHGGNLLAAAGTVTDDTGNFTIDSATGSFALALAGDDWSDVVALGDGPITLHVLGHGTLHGKLTYGGHADSFAVSLRLAPDARFMVRDETEADGGFTIASLPVGTYTLTAGLAQAFGGGASETIDRQIVIVAGQTTEVELAFAVGATIAVTSLAPEGMTPQGIQYWLFSGAAPATGGQARQRAAAEHPRQLAIGGHAKGEPTEFHDVPAGSYVVCAAFFDARTMAAMDAPFGCAPVVVHDGDTVHEIDVALRNL